MDIHNLTPIKKVEFERNLEKEVNISTGNTNSKLKSFSIIPDHWIQQPIPELQILNFCKFLNQSNALSKKKRGL